MDDRIMYIGVDLGGTNIATAFVDENGDIFERVSIPTNAKNGADGVLDGIIESCELLLEKADIEPFSIGIGIPGAVRDDIGVAVFTPNLPLRDVDMISRIKDRFGCPIYIGNDANCAVLGEAIAGSAKGARDVVLITLGTGLGGGIVINGKLHTGLSGAAGEVGHTVIVADGRQCGCGRKGCWETYASATGLITTALEMMKEHPESLLWELCDHDTEKVGGRIIFKAVRAADQTALLIVDEYIRYLAMGIGNLVNILEPDIFSIGGGISNEWDVIEGPLVKAVESETIMQYSKGVPKTKFVRATLGNDAGIIGAAFLGVQSRKRD